MNWEMMAAWLRAEWQNIDYEVHPLHKGLFEGRSECADVIAKCPADWTAEQKLQALYEFFKDTFPRTDSPEESNDE